MMVERGSGPWAGRAARRRGPAPSLAPATSPDQRSTASQTPRQAALEEMTSFLPCQPRPSLPRHFFPFCENAADRRVAGWVTVAAPLALTIIRNLHSDTALSQACKL